MISLSPLDKLLEQCQQALEIISGHSKQGTRDYPAEKTIETDLTTADKKHIAGLMRVNHAGEIAAQALYQGQALTARSDTIKIQMQQSCIEEIDHLNWCRQRIEEMGSKPSLLTPLWYAGSFAIGAMAGIAGDEWSLGFVEETENQVMKHLESHIEKLPIDDQKTKIILKQMYQDEAHHADVARQAGAKELPKPVKKLMTLVSKVMTKTAYWV